jgi:hypothetical protein
MATWKLPNNRRTLHPTTIVSPSRDGGRFNLQIDGVTEAANIRDQGTTGPQPVNPGQHVAGETLGARTAPIYVQSIWRRLRG